MIFFCVDDICIYCERSLIAIFFSAFSLWERVGVRGRKQNGFPPLPNPLPQEFATNCDNTEDLRREFSGERGQMRNFKGRGQAIIYGIRSPAPPAAAAG